MAQKHLLKIISIFVSLVLWVYVLSTAHIQIEKVIPIKYKLPEGQALVSSIQREVIYVLDTPKAFIRSLMDRDDSIEVDLTKIRPRKKGSRNYVVDFKVTDIKLPIGVNVVQVIPKRVVVTLERSMKRTVKIVPKFSGEFPEGREMLDSSLRPSEVEISGPRSIVRGLKSVETFPIERSQLKESGQKVISLQVSDERLKSSHNESLFLFDIRPTSANIRLSEVPIIFKTSRFLRKVSHRRVTLFLLANKRELSDEDREQIEVLAPLKNTTAKQQVDLRVKLPAGVQLLKIVPESVVVYTR